MDFHADVANVVVIVKHTYFELSSRAEGEEEPISRGRCFSDSVITYEAECCVSSSKMNWADDDDATSAGSTCGIMTPSCHSDDEVEDLTLPVSYPEGALNWMPMTPVWSNTSGHNSNGCVFPTHVGATCQHVVADPKQSMQSSVHPKTRVNGTSTDRTTVMLKNLPSEYSRAELLTLLTHQGLDGLYNFVYIPMDFATGACLGYATVNLETHYVAELAMKLLQGFNQWNSDKILEACWNMPHQGLEELIEFYRNSRSMHSKVPASYKPVLLSNGRPVTFPSPTRQVPKPAVLQM